MQNVCVEEPRRRCENTHMSQRSLASEKKEQIAERVRLLRSVIASTQVELCLRLGISTNTWSHYEAGRSPPSEPVIAKLKALHGVTRDWIMDGSYSGMDIDLVRKLESATAPVMRKNRRRASA